MFVFVSFLFESKESQNALKIRMEGLLFHYKSWP